MLKKILMNKTKNPTQNALEQANKIAFAPVIFQATVALRDLGILDFIFKNRRKSGTTFKDIQDKLSISDYGLSVLLEIAESSDIVTKDDDGNFQLTETGYFLTYNQMVDVNLNFTNDVCYQGLQNLKESIESGKPEGLKALGNWSTVYEGLSELPETVQKSWFEFDHYYSDGIFDKALERVFKNDPITIFDVGANTGKFTLKCLEYNDSVSVKMFDLKGQLAKGLKNIEERDSSYLKRTSTYDINWLDENLSIPKDADVIWMSQFLDCFSKDEIVKILQTCTASMDTETELIIVETFTDRQEHDNAKFVLEATSLYFTAIANGNSKMYKATEFKSLVSKAGLKIVEDSKLGDFHTMLVCKKRKGDL